MGELGLAWEGLLTLVQPLILWSQGPWDPWPKAPWAPGTHISVMCLPFVVNLQMKVYHGELEFEMATLSFYHVT